MHALVAHAREHIRQVLAGDSTGHDWWHTERVWRMATQLARIEQADTTVVQVAALLHDIADWKFHAGNADAGAQAARAWLTAHLVPAELVEHVCEIIHGVTFKGAGVPTPMRTIEGRIVQDADRLDALGAIGIARAFAYGGAKGQPLHDPSAPPVLHASFEHYQQHRGSTLNHFYEKLLLLADRMQTAAARQIAKERTQFMREFLTRFKQEWSADLERPC